MKEVILYALGKLKYKELPHIKMLSKDILVGRMCFSADHNAADITVFVKATVQH